MLWCIFIMAEATAKLARWRLRTLEIEFSIVYHVVMNCQAAEALSPLKIEGENKKTRKDKVGVLTVS